jgi:pimeloyl-ACP methyl ester carboxylesterase
MGFVGLNEQVVEGAGVPLRALVPAAAPAALLIHGLGRDAEHWAPVAAQLQAIVYDRRGYGASGRPEPYVGTTVEEQTEDAVRLLAALGVDAPLTVAGDGFGALVALDLARRHPRHVRALALADPVLLALLADGADWLAAQRADLQSRLRDGTAAAQLAYFADLTAIGSWAVTRRELAAIGVPIVLATTPAASAQTAAAVAALAKLLPAAQRIDGDLVDAVSALAP